MASCLKSLDGIAFDVVQENELAGLAKALAHPARIRLLRILSGGVCLGSDLVGQLDLAQSTVSEHLRILREAGLVEAAVQHPRTCFKLRIDSLERIQQLLGDLAK